MPANIEAEQFVLGSILLDDSLFPQVAGILESDDFHLGKHKILFQRMFDLAERNERIEYMTLVNELMKHTQLEAVDGVAYISTLTDGMPRLSSIDSYIRIVKDKSLLRTLITTAHQIIADSIEGGMEAEEALATAESAIMKVGDVRLRSGLVNPREIVQTFPGGAKAFLDPSKRETGIPTGFLKLDEMTTGLHGGELIIVAARPAMGKTAFALTLAQYVATEYPNKPGLPVAVFSLEMSKESLLTRLLCGTASVDAHRFRGGFLNQDERRRLNNGLNTLLKSKLFIDDSADATLMDIAAKVRRLKAEQGLGLVIVDYLQLMNSKGKTESRVQEISALSRGLKLLAKDLDIPIIALSQLSRAPELRQGDHRPQLSDLRDSGSIEQDADVVGFIFREEVYKPDRDDLHGVAELILSKQRNGPTGRVKLTFIHKFAKFSNPIEDGVDEMEDGDDAPPPDELDVPPLQDMAPF